MTLGPIASLHRLRSAVPRILKPPFSRRNSFVINNHPRYPARNQNLPQPSCLRGFLGLQLDGQFVWKLLHVLTRGAIISFCGSHHPRLGVFPWTHYQVFCNFLSLKKFGLSTPWTPYKNFLFLTFLLAFLEYVR